MLRKACQFYGNEKLEYYTRHASFLETKNLYAEEGIPVL